MRMVLISADDNLHELVHSALQNIDIEMRVFRDSNDPLDIISTLCSLSPGIIILDDDFCKPNSARILKTVKSVSKNTSMIFITSDESINLGKEVSQVGIQLYTIKPVPALDIRDAVVSILKHKDKQ